MKKAITIFALFMVFCLGLQTVNAQKNKLQINEIASEKTELLRQSLKFDQQQWDEIYKVYQFYVKGTSELRNPEVQKVSLEKLNTYRDEKFKSILTEDQYKRYLKLKEE